MTALIWFRRDLRVHDHVALRAALDRHEQVVPVFCLDDRLLQGRHRSPARTRFLLESLRDLDRSLRDRGSGLVIRHDRPEQALAELARAVGASEVHATDDVGPFARRRDHRVAVALKRAGTQLDLHPGQFVVDDLDALRTGAGNPYSVFTPFHRRWQHAPRRQPASAPRSMPAVPARLARGRLPSARSLGAGAAASRHWPGGEQAGRDRMRSFLQDLIQSYDEHHDDLATRGTSGLSPYLHLGCVSARELEAGLPEGSGPEAFRRQLCWRDFYAHVLLHHPANTHSEHQARFRSGLRWSRSERLFDAWREGRTGYPLVDAGMRELARDGWMHNRARMVVGSFLVKDLGIDWRRGERWFMEMLIDGDEANNNGNWQWIASVGVDTQPPSRRIYNPTLQQRRFDPGGVYVRANVPELRNVPDPYLAEPWTMPPQLQRETGCVIGVDYPAPIVDHAHARRAALDRYANAADQGHAPR